MAKSFFSFHSRGLLAPAFFSALVLGGKDSLQGWRNSLGERLVLSKSSLRALAMRICGCTALRVGWTSALLLFPVEAAAASAWSPHVEVRNSSLGGRGLFALTTFYPGDVILLEEATITIQKPVKDAYDYLNKIQHAYSQLDGQQKEDVRALVNSRPDHPKLLGIVEVSIALLLAFSATIHYFRPTHSDMAHPLHLLKVFL